jgi:hypothetical protein
VFAYENPATDPLAAVLDLAGLVFIPAACAVGGFTVAFGDVACDALCRRAVASDALSRLTGKAIELPQNSVAFTSPSTCPACGASDVMWGCDEQVTSDRNRIHPLVWHPTEWMADSFVCGACDAGWIEPDDPAPIVWVRPYWIVDA